MGNSVGSRFGERRNNPDTRTDKFGWDDRNGSGAVRVRLSAEQRAECDLAYEEFGAELAVVFESVDAGFKFSLSYSARNRAYFGTLTDKREGSETEGRWVTLSAGDPDKAVFRILWVVGELVSGDLLELEKLSEGNKQDW